MSAESDALNIAVMRLKARMDNRTWIQGHEGVEYHVMTEATWDEIRHGITDIIEKRYADAGVRNPAEDRDGAAGGGVLRDRGEGG